MPFDITEPFIVAAEVELGAILPASYRTSMLQKNGGEFEAEDDDWVQYPIADTSDQKRLSRTANHIIKETKYYRSWANFPKTAIAIAGNGTGDQIVFLRNGKIFEAAVYHWFHETGIITKIANDFSEIAKL